MISEKLNLQCCDVIFNVKNLWSVYVKILRPALIFCPLLLVLFSLPGKWLYLIVVMNLNFSKFNGPAEFWEPFDGLPLLLWVSLTLFIIIIIFLKK